MYQTIKNMSTFTINERFDFLTAMVSMVAKGKTPSAIITGAGGLGKTFTVQQTLKSLNLKNVSNVDDFDDSYELANAHKCYRFIKGYSTAKALYKTLYKNNGATIVFDDCDNVLKDKVGINILKSALDSYDTRIISWKNSLTATENHWLPSCFEFTGNVIFISNLDMNNIPQPLRSRALCVDVSMSKSEKFERMGTIIKSKDFMPEVTMLQKRQAFDELKKHNRRLNELSLRTLVSACKIRNAGGTKWKQLLEYSLVTQTINNKQ